MSSHSPSPSPGPSNSSRHRLLAVLLGAVVLIGGANLAAYAANGQPLLLGKTGVATKKTTVKNNGAGPALHLKTKPGQPPLKVNRTKKVNNLNADLVDGHSAADLENKVWVYALSTPPGQTGITTFTLPGLPPGRYLAFFNVASYHNPAEPDFFGCWVWTGKLTGVTYSDFQVWYGGQSGHAYVDATSEAPTFRCQASGGGTYRILGDERFSEITLISVDSATVGAEVGSPSRGVTGGRISGRP